MFQVPLPDDTTRVLLCQKPLPGPHVIISGYEDTLPSGPARILHALSHWSYKTADGQSALLKFKGMNPYLAMRSADVLRSYHQQQKCHRVQLWPIYVSFDLNLTALTDGTQ